jgi:c-di-GMP-binding flagellar brake protein YcgR
MDQSTENPPAQNAARYEGRTDKITDPARIAGLLTRMLNERALLSVSLANVSGTFNSAVLEVHPERGFFVIDELSPPSGNRYLAKVSWLRIQARLKGVEISLDALLESSGTQDGATFYNLTLPGSLSYRQQRAHYRAKVGAAKAIPVRLTRENGDVLAGELNDLSLGGLGIRFRGKLPEDLERGEEIQRCSVHLPTGDDIACRIEVRFLSVGITGNTRMLGARFLELTSIQQAALARFVAMLDRELARKSHDVRD